MYVIEICMFAACRSMNFMLFGDICYCGFETGSHVSQSGFKLLNLLVLPPGPWDYRYAPDTS